MTYRRLMLELLEANDPKGLADLEKAGKLELYLEQTADVAAEAVQSAAAEAAHAAPEGWESQLRARGPARARAHEEAVALLRELSRPSQATTD